MSGVQPSDAAREAAVRAYDDAPEGLTHQEAIGAALAAGLAVEYPALLSDILTRLSDAERASQREDLGYYAGMLEAGEVVCDAFAAVRAAGGTP